MLPSFLSLPSLSALLFPAFIHQVIFNEPLQAWVFDLKILCRPSLWMSAKHLSGALVTHREQSCHKGDHLLHLYQVPGLFHIQYFIYS